MTENKDHDKLFADLDALSEQQIEVGLAAGVWNEQVRPLVQHYLYDLKLKGVEAAAGRLTEMEKAVRGHIGLTYIPIPFSKNVRSRNLVPSQFAPLRASLGDAGPALFLYLALSETCASLPFHELSRSWISRCFASLECPF